MMNPGFEIPASPVARGDHFLLRTSLLLELSSPPGECKIKKSKYVNFPELYLECKIKKSKYVNFPELYLE